MSAPTWWRSGLLLLVTLVAGVAIGMGVERRRAPTHGPGAAMTAPHVIRHLSAELALDSTQRAAVIAILHRRQGGVDSSWHAVRPHLQAVLDSTVEEILTVLSPDQATKFHRLVSEMHGAGK